MIHPHLEICIICDTIVTDPQLHEGQYYCATCDPFTECYSCEEHSKDMDPTTLLCPDCLAKAKECCHCKKLKPLSAYYKQKTSPDGRKPSCKVCASEAQARSRLARGKTIRTPSALVEQTDRLTVLEGIVKAQQIEIRRILSLLNSVGLSE